MAFNNIDELDAMHVDVLTELGNIGSGNAATALASFMGKEIDINVPHVRILGFNEVADYVGGPENIVMGLLIKMDGDVNGMILYIFDNDLIKNVMKVFFNKDFTSFDDLDEMSISAFSEIGNIMAGAYVNALSAMTSLSINISTPSICIDMAGAILSVPSIEFAQVGNKVLFIDDSFGIGINTGKVKSNMILVPEMDSLNKIFERLGIM
ncbi:chemotaxis protein CheC [Porcipelethomonas sp.]|uniref:chemotaxis protein CheC n=1 Tax=Porcipelethomonas sp. TaxID=2981675 RepID=UPI003EF76C5D